MVGMCGGDVDDVDLAIVHERAVVAVASGNPVTGCETRSAVGVSGGHSRDDVAVRQADVDAEGVGDGARAEDSPTDGTATVVKVHARSSATELPPSTTRH